MAITGAVLAGTAVASTAASIDANKRAARRQKRANELQTNQQLGEQRVSRQQSEREARVRRARVLMAGEASGTGGSSQELGFLSGMGTLYAAQQGQQAGNTLAALRIGDLNQQAADAATKAQTFQAISNLSMQAASFAAGQAKPASGGGG